MTSARWPLRPLALSGETYFVLSSRILLTGVAEDPRDYVIFCHANGVFRQELVPVPTHAQTRHDALALRQSPAWKSLKWRDRADGGSYTMSEQTIWDNIKAEVDAVKSP